MQIKQSLLKERQNVCCADMIDKCAKAGAFDSQKYKLPDQYYALIEIGGAYAYKFIPFAEFLGTHALFLLIWILCLVKEVRTGEYITILFRFHAVKRHLMKL